MECDRCGGGGKYFQENPDCANCPSKDECDDFGKRYCTVPSDCPDCHGTGTNPEPGQDERIRKEYFLKNGMPCNEEGMFYPKYVEHIEALCISSNAEIKSLKSRLMACEGAVKMLNDMDDENQKTIQSLRCCGNCGHGYSGSYTINNLSCMECERGIGILDNWTPKSKLWKDSTPTEIENDFRKIGGLPPLPEPPCTP